MSRRLPARDDRGRFVRSPSPYSKALQHGTRAGDYWRTGRGGRSLDVTFDALLFAVPRRRRDAPSGPGLVLAALLIMVSAVALLIGWTVYGLGRVDVATGRAIARARARRRDERELAEKVARAARAAELERARADAPGWESWCRANDMPAGAWAWSVIPDEADVPTRPSNGPVTESVEQVWRASAGQSRSRARSG